MEIFSVFFVYLLRKLRRVWWQVALVAGLFWLPGDLVLNYFDNYHFEDEFNLWPSLLWHSWGGMAYDVLVWTLGILMILNIVRASDAGELGGQEEAPGWNQHLVLALKLWPALIFIRFLVYMSWNFACLALCIPFIYLGVKLALVEMTYFHEGARGLDPLRRSWKLTDGRFWEVLGLMVLATFLVIMVWVPVLAGVIGLSYAYPQVDDPEYWFIDAVTSLPFNIAGAYWFIFAYCLYEYLKWREDHPEAGSAEDFIHRHDPPSDALFPGPDPETDTGPLPTA